MPVAGLLKEYAAWFEGRTPPSSNRGFLMRRIAFRLQERAYGGLSEEAKRRIEELKVSLNPLGELMARRGAGGGASEGRDRRLPSAGTVIRREYRGRAIEVMVSKEGLQYDGRVYRSLTAVAKEVTGSHWNGFHFFGLR